MQQRLKLEPSWQNLLADQFDRPHMHALRAFLLSEKRLGKHIYPAGANMFAALDLVPVEQVKVVIIGQDPYHGAGQAQGLSFSVPSGMDLPPSLRNIFNEIQSDLGLEFELRRCSGDLGHWAAQGVLLLNAVLSVEHGRAGSHQGKGWEEFTDTLVDRLSNRREGLVFMLWGSYAQKKGQRVDQRRHHVLTCPHPSPLSAHRGFLGCKHFSRANSLLRQQGLSEVDWQPQLLPSAQ